MQMRPPFSLKATDIEIEAFKDLGYPEGWDTPAYLYIGHKNSMKRRAEHGQ